MEFTEALKYVSRVTFEGKVSKSKGYDCYCFVTTFSDGTTVYCDVTKSGTDVISVWKEN